MPERGDLLLAEGGAGGDRAMESAVQHGTAPFVTALQAPGTRSNLAAATGAWRYGKRSAFPTSPHPRRRRTNVERRVTLTFHLVQKICQVIPTDTFFCFSEPNPCWPNTTSMESSSAALGKGCSRTRTDCELMMTTTSGQRTME